MGYVNSLEGIPVPWFPIELLVVMSAAAEAGPSYAERKARREEEFATDLAAGVCVWFVWEDFPTNFTNVHGGKILQV